MKIHKLLSEDTLNTMRNFPVKAEKPRKKGKFRPKVPKDKVKSGN